MKHFYTCPKDSTNALPKLHPDKKKRKKKKKCNRRDCSAHINNSITSEKGSKAAGVPINA
jgi:hypothetical protein